MSRTIIYVHVKIILDVPIPFKNASVLSQIECPWLHTTINNMVVFLLKIKKIPTQKGEHFCKCTELSLKLRGYTPLSGDGSLSFLFLILFKSAYLLTDFLTFTYSYSLKRYFLNRPKKGKMHLIVTVLHIGT